MRNQQSILDSPQPAKTDNMKYDVQSEAMSVIDQLETGIETQKKKSEPPGSPKSSIMPVPVPISPTITSNPKVMQLGAVGGIDGSPKSQTGRSMFGGGRKRKGSVERSGRSLFSGFGGAKARDIFSSRNTIATVATTQTEISRTGAKRAKDRLVRVRKKPGPCEKCVGWGKFVVGLGFVASFFVLQSLCWLSGEVLGNNICDFSEENIEIDYRDGVFFIGFSLALIVLAFVIVYGFQNSDRGLLRGRRKFIRCSHNSLLILLCRCHAFAAGS